MFCLVLVCGVLLFADDLVILAVGVIDVWGGIVNA